MKTAVVTFFAIILAHAVSLAQSWQTLGAGFFGAGQISSNVQVLSYQDTAFVAYSDMDVVYVKKRSGSTWATVGTYPTENNYYKFIYGHDNKPLFVRLSRGQADVGTTGFFADIHLYENGEMTMLESQLLEFVADNQVSNLQVSNFDFTARPDGSMASIIRFPSSARSVYNVKIGSHAWFAETVFYGAIGGSSGNAIERSKISFNDQGVVIVSRLNNQTLGAAHLFLHNLNSSTPTASHFNNAAFSVGSGIEPIYITSKSDTTFAVIRDQVSNEILWKFYFDSSNEPLSLAQVVNYGIASPRVIPIFTENENYLMYFEPDFAGEGFIATVDNTYELSSAQNIGDTYFTMNENLVAPAAFNVDPISGEVYVAYVHGPPMTQTRLRKFGCGNATAAFNSSTETLSVTSTHDASATFAWTLCESTNVLSTASSFEPEEDGLYQVTVTEGGCVIASSCIQVQLIEDLGVGIEGNFVDLIVLYPNPAENEFIIDGIQELSDIQIIDLSGKLVWSKKNCQDLVVLNSSTWENGVYFVKIQNGKYITIKKVVKK